FSLADHDAAWPSLTRMPPKEFPDDVVSLHVHRDRAEDAAGERAAGPGVAAPLDYVQDDLRAAWARVIGLAGDLEFVLGRGEMSDLGLGRAAIALDAAGNRVLDGQESHEGGDLRARSFKRDQAVNRAMDVEDRHRGFWLVLRRGYGAGDRR